MDDVSGSRSVKFSISMSSRARDRLEKMMLRTGFTASKVVETLILLMSLPNLVILSGKEENLGDGS